MAVKIRLTRGGRKKRPFYRVVAAKLGAKRDGRFLEMLGTYDPLKDPSELKMNAQRLEYWLSQGAQSSSTVSSLLKNQKASGNL